MAAQTKNKLEALISDGKIQHIYGLVGCCKNLFRTVSKRHPKIPIQP